jgi:glyoxylase-like metal-dependent hydrolase (beta-lactamase superfamily II)
MIVERSLNDQFLSNTYLVADGEGGPGFFVDAGGPVAPLLEVAKRLQIEPTHVLLTHHHFDHVSEVGALCKRWPKLEVLANPLEREALAEMGEAIGKGAQLGTIDTGEILVFGGLEVRPLKTPGHTAGMLSFLVSEASSGMHSSGGSGRPGAGSGPGGFHGGDAVVFTGDTLFKDSVGGVRAPGHTTYTDLRDSIMGTLMELPGDTIVYPGHTDATSVAREWEHNPFIRVWRGLDAEGSEPCTALGEPATLVLLGDDYDGGKKAWVRWPDGKDDIVPGSRVERSG